MRIPICFLRHTRRRLSQARAPLFAVGLLVLVCSCAHAQTTTSKPSNPPPDLQPPGSEKSERPAPDFGDPATEIRTKLMIKAEKKEYDENLARAKEAGDIASQLCESYESKKAFTSEDGKRLERLEKLTKRIRNEAGGSDSDPDESDLPRAMETAVKKVAELADDLRKEVEKTPRHVISAAVIHQANKLIGLIQYLRNQDRR